MREAGIVKGIKFALLQSPFMSQILSEASFIECDITYLEHPENKYLFNVTAFDEEAMKWVIVGRCLLSKDNSDGYSIGFSKVFSMARSDSSNFEVGKTLKGIVIDWSDAEACGLRKAIGDTVANSLLRGCQVHWSRSYQRVADKACRTAEEKKVYNTVASRIPCSKSKASVLLHFQVLCGEKALETLNLHGIEPFNNSHWGKAKT
jgi:hypothetical protein